MTASEVIERLQATRSEWEPLGVGALFLFGSICRGEAREDSDIDVLVEFNRRVTLFQFIELKDRLSEILGREVDLVTRAALKPQLRDQILAEVIRAA